jgi:hypothetical protein
VDLAFALPKTYRTSPRAGEDTLPVPATWAYAPDRVVDDLTKRPPPFHSRRFPRWTTVDARALRAIDTAVAKLAAARPVTLAALRRAIAATNRHADEIDTIRAEELFETLEKIARRGGLADPAAVIDAQRDW